MIKYFCTLSCVSTFFETALFSFDKNNTFAVIYFYWWIIPTINLTVYITQDMRYDVLIIYTIPHILRPSHAVYSYPSYDLKRTRKALAQIFVSVPSLFDKSILLLIAAKRRQKSSETCVRKSFWKVQSVTVVIHCGHIKCNDGV